MEEVTIPGGDVLYNVKGRMPVHLVNYSTLDRQNARIDQLLTTDLRRKKITPLPKNWSNVCGGERVPKVKPKTEVPVSVEIVSGETTLVDRIQSRLPQ